MSFWIRRWSLFPIGFIIGFFLIPSTQTGELWELLLTGIWCPAAIALGYGMGALSRQKEFKDTHVQIELTSASYFCFLIAGIVAGLVVGFYI